MSSPPPSKIQKKSSATYGRSRRTTTNAPSTTSHLPLPLLSSASSSSSTLTPVASSSDEEGMKGKRRLESKVVREKKGGGGKEREEVDWEQIPTTQKSDGAGTSARMGGIKRRKSTLEAEDDGEEGDNRGGGGRRKLSRTDSTSTNGLSPEKLKGPALRRGIVKVTNNINVLPSTSRTLPTASRNDSTAATTSIKEGLGSSRERGAETTGRGRGKGERKEKGGEGGTVVDSRSRPPAPPPAATKSTAAPPPSRNSTMPVPKPSAAPIDPPAPSSRPPPQPTRSASSSKPAAATTDNSIASTSKSTTTSKPAPPPPPPPHSPTSSKLISRPSTPTQSRPSTPSSLTPTQTRHQLVGTPSKPARNLSALFEFHGAGGGTKLTGQASESSPELTSPRKKTRRVLLGEEEGGMSSEIESNEEEEEEEEVLINLPKTGGGGMVGRMLKRSNTAPDSLLTRGGISSSTTGAGAQHQQHHVPLGSPARTRVDVANGGSSSYFALSQSTSQIPASPSSAHLRTGPPSAPGSAPPSPGPAPAIVAAATRPPLGQKRTYGGGTRSMLASMDGVLDGTGVGGGEERGESYAVLSKRWGIEEEGGESQDTIDLPTITELRARGENQRFLDDLGYIVDGLEGESVAVKRPSAVDLVRRLLNTDFRRSIKTLDGAENLYNVMREAGAGDGDMVLDAALAIFLAILAKDARSIEQILRRKGEDCFVVVGKMLRSREDGFSLARSVEGGRPMKSKDRLAVNLMNELVRIHGLSGIGLEGSQISLRAVASSIFASIVTASGSRVDRFAVLEGAGVSKRIAASLEAEIETLPSRIKGHEKGLPLLPKEDPPDFEHVEHCLTILENLVVRFPEAQKMVESTRPDLPSLLGTLLVACHCLVGDEEEDEESSLALIGMNCLVTALRVLVNVTNTSPFWCEGVLQSQPVITTILRLIHTSNLPTPDSPRLLAPLLSSPSKVFPSSSPLPPIPGVSDLSGEVDESAALTAATEALKVDVLCLSLGLLNNLVEGVEAARDRVRRTELSKTCNGSRTCVLQCRCSDRRSGLLLLVDFYTKQVEGTSTEASYLSGYSVLLLSHLLSSSQTNAKIILDALPSPPTSNSSTDSQSSHQDKLASMASELRDFADVHQRFHQKLTTITQAVLEKTEEEELEEWVGGATGGGVGGGGVLPAVVPSMEEGVGAVQRMIGVLEGLMKTEE